jgi:hypothetical protein
MAGADPAASPYAGQRDADIKALTPAELAGLLDGKGLGFAKSAELNGYPGPMHVLELRNELGLDDAQLAATQALFERMRNAARAEGTALVAAERHLDGLYATRTANEANVAEALRRIESRRARLRGIHLDAHLAQARLLAGHQIARYAELRGYAARAGHTH